MTTLYLLLYMLSGGFFVLAVLNVDVRKLNMLAAGLLCWVLVPLIQTFQVL